MEAPKLTASLPSALISFIEPPRDLLRPSTNPNCLYKTQLNHLPLNMNSCEELNELARANNDPPIPIDLDLTRQIYKREIQLTINPFEEKKFYRSINMESRLQPMAQPPEPKQDQLVFDSHFESGNLLSVNKEIIGHRYHLLMQNDINTYGCTQWFFFKTLNMERLKATFCINNFYKPKSLYSSGMKVLVFSKKKFLEEGNGWVRGAQAISYFSNRAVERRDGKGISKRYFTLKFEYSYDYEEDEVYFAYNYPYTYSRLNSYLAEKAREKNSFYGCRTLCRTLAENMVSLITITDHEIPRQEKNTVFVTSRVHPGETVSSLVMEGIVDFLTSSAPMASELRKKFIFRLVPMLNPDGVIHGNYRTNLAGIDLNRVWHCADKQLSPEIYELRKFILECDRECPVLMFCDLHGHSSRKSAFIYGCQPSSKARGRKERVSQSRLFPFMLSSENEDFRFGSCNFMINKSKEGTARIQLWKDLKISNVYTLESSFCSSQDSGYHFRPSDYRQIGISFCKTIHEYYFNEENKNSHAQKLKLIKNVPLSDPATDSDSDTDLFDDKTIKRMKEGMSQSVVVQKMEFQKPLLNPEKRAPVKVERARRIFTQQNYKTVTADGSPTLQRGRKRGSQTRKVMEVSMPTKRIIFDTQVMKPPVRSQGMRRSVVQKIEHGYRGKSSLYRIKRKTGVLQGDNSRQSMVMALDSSIDYF